MGLKRKIENAKKKGLGNIWGDVRVDVISSARFYKYTDLQGREQKLEWYDGQITPLAEGEKDFEDPVTIVVLDKKLVKSIAACERRLKEHPLRTSSRLQRIRYCGYSIGLAQHIVAFDPFQGFLTQENVGLLDKTPLMKPRYVYTPGQKIDPDCLPDNPVSFIRTEIIELLQELEAMELSGVFCSVLSLSFCVVWSSGKLRFLFADLLLADLDKETRNETVRNGLSDFGNNVVNFLLRYPGADPKDINDWKEREIFMECFDKEYPYHRNRIYMTYTHPFLKGDAKAILEFISHVHHCVDSKEYVGRDRVDAQLLMAAFKDSTFCDNFMNDGSWFPENVTKPIDIFLRSYPRLPYPMADLSNAKHCVKYDVKDCSQLLKFLRDLYQHYYPKPPKGKKMLKKYKAAFARNNVKDLDAVACFVEIKENWDRLMHALHHASICGSTLY